MSKKVAIDFLEKASSGRVREAFRHTTAGFRHHNAYFASDGESLARGMEENAKANPAKKCEVKQAIEEGDRVMLFSHVRHNAGERGFALAHVFRFEGDKIAELWDVAQQIPDDMKNERGMF